MILFQFVFIAHADMLLSVCVFLCFAGFSYSLKPDEFFKICRRNDTNLDNCIINSLNDMKPLLRKGIPKLKIPSLEPMIVPKVSVTQGKGPVSIDSTFMDLKINGITNFQLKSVKANLDKYQIDFEAKLPYMLNVGDYAINGKILILPIAGKGASWTNYTDVDIKASLIGKPVTRNGNIYFDVISFDFDLNVAKADIHMENLFNGNKELGDTMNKFMSDNWEVVYKELKPVINEAVSVLLKDVAVKVFRAFPMNELFN